MLLLVVLLLLVKTGSNAQVAVWFSDGIAGSEKVLAVG